MTETGSARMLSMHAFMGKLIKLGHKIYGNALDNACKANMGIGRPVPAGAVPVIIKATNFCAIQA